MCASACGDTGDYCNAAPNVITQACDTCLNKYTAAGKACDTTSTGAIEAACDANADCAAYNTCAGGCP
jgi:hypothetical protein